jgi:hypothetical protein
MMFPSSLTFWFVSTVILGSNPSFAFASLRGNNIIYHPEEQASRVLETTVEATYLIKDESREYGRDLQGNPHDQTASLELPDGRIYVVYNAPAQWEKSLKSGRDKVRIPAGSVFSSDGTVNVKGKNLSKINEVKNGFVRRNLLGDDAERTHEQELNLAALQFTRKLQTGTRRVLAVRVIVNDGAYNHANQAGLSNDVFGNGIDPVNLKSQYAACSYNQLVFEKSLDRNLLTTITPNIGDTAISNGVVDIRVNHNKTAGDGIIVNAVTAEINRVFGVTNPNQLANHVMYCLPSGVMSGIAYAYINSWNSVYSNQWCNYLSGQMHEVS